MFFGAILNRTDNIKKLGSSQTASLLLSDVFEDRLIQAQILDLNTEGQLYEKGIDSNGNSLGSYAPSTIKRKRNAGRLGRDTRADHLTLKDTGAFYESFRFINGSQGFTIEANTIKDGGDDLLDVSRNILGLTDESKTEVVQMVTEPFIVNIREFI